MSCLNENTLKNYVKNELNEEDVMVIEDHLYDCDDCLTIYLDVIQEYEDHLPVIHNPTEFTGDVFIKIKEAERCEKKHARQSPLIHYMLAAGFTLILMFSGVFDSLTTIVSDESMTIEKSGSFSNDMLDRTVNMIERMNKDK